MKIGIVIIRFLRDNKHDSQSVASSNSDAYLFGAGTEIELKDKGTFELALRPDDLPRLIVERLNTAAVEGIVALYERDAILIGANGESIQGKAAIRTFYSQLVSAKPQFQPGAKRCSVQHGDTALTSSLLANGTVAVEVARLPADGTWLWIIDNPSIAQEMSRR
jgi:ketosteroid isomerase-like protein